MISGGMITKISNNEYRMNGSVMDRNAYENFICQNCPEAWEKHLRAKRTITAGWTCFSVGIFLTGMFGLLAAQDEWVGNSFTGYPTTSLAMKISSITLGSIGAGAALGGSVLLARGYAAKHNTYKLYNMRCASYASTPIIFNLTAGQNGIGVAMNF